MKKNFVPSIVLGLLFAVNLWATIVIGNTDVEGGTEPSVTTTAVDSSGSTAAVLFTAYQQNTLTISDSKSNTYTNLTQMCNAGASVCIRVSYVCGGTYGTGHTATAAGANTYPAAVFIPLSGTLTTGCSDGESAGADGNSATTSLQPGTLTPSQNDGIVLTGCAYLLNHGSASADGGFTLVRQLAGDGVNFDGIAVFSLIQSAAAATNPTITWNNGTNVACISAAFKVAAGGGGAGAGARLLVGVGK